MKKTPRNITNAHLVRSHLAYRYISGHALQIRRLFHFSTETFLFRPNLRNLILCSFGRSRVSYKSTMTQEDLFDDVLNVESRYYDEGYNNGLKDGAKHGLAEGRAFGLQKGYEKFLESGRLAGKSMVWANRLPSNRSTVSADQDAAQLLPPLPSNARLEKNISTLHTLVDPKLTSIENTDAAVQDIDDRLKKAQGKERIIDRVVNGTKQDAPKTS